jgi:hypothetical protein
MDSRRRTVVDLALWIVGTLAMLAAFTWIVSALDSRAIVEGGPPAHEPMLAVVQIPGSPPVAVRPEQLAGFPESTQRIPSPPQGWVPYGDGETVSWDVDGNMVRVTWSDGDRAVTTVWAADLMGIRAIRSERVAVGQMFLALLPTAFGSVFLRYGLRRRSERLAAAGSPSGQATGDAAPR